MSDSSLTGHYQPSKVETNLVFLGYIVFTIICACVYKHRDKNSLTTKFNAGGNIPISILASTIISQWTWAATLLQSTSVGVDYGLSGPYWYAAGACIQILLFSIVCMEVRIKAPGARTFLQIIRARFDKKTHIIYCVFALLTNAIVTGMLLVGGVASISYTFPNIAGEYAILLFIMSMSLHLFIGGLGGMIYVSFFSTLFILIVVITMVVRVFYAGNKSNTDFGNMKVIFSRYSSISNPSNFQGSSKTLMSLDGLIFGIINVIGNFGAVFVDQLNAVSSPKKSSIAFIIGGSIWFFIPFCFGSTMSIAYLYSNSFSKNGSLLTCDQIKSGLVMPFVAGLSFGDAGEFLVNVMIIFALTTTGSGEILAVTSILINDIFSVYIKPFKRDLVDKDNLVCILCQKLRGRVGAERRCTCISITNCSDCKTDDSMLKENSIYPRQCPMHGKYLDYESYLNIIRNYSIMFTVVVMLFIALVLFYLKISLNWLYLFMGIIIGPAVVPVALCLFWARINSLAMFLSLPIGCAAGLISWIVSTVALYQKFNLETSGNNYPMLIGNLFSIGVGGILVVILTRLTTKPLNVDQIGEVWENTRDIDSPLLPWTEVYAKEINIQNATDLKCRPSLLEIESQLRSVRKLSWILSITLTIFVIIVWPTIMIIFGNFDYRTFQFWLIIGQIFILISFLFCLTGPFFELVFIRQLKKWIKIKSCK